jgi:NAD(P)-dependent dehydrogenase (short-subunit alcohol dehydrogenase family)
MNTQTQKIALITGGSRGLGRNTAESLARKGVDSVITYQLRADEARAVVAAIHAQGRKAVALQLDTGATKTFAGFAEKLKRTLQDTWG